MHQLNLFIERQLFHDQLGAQVRRQRRIHPRPRSHRRRFLRQARSVSDGGEGESNRERTAAHVALVGRRYIDRAYAVNDIKAYSNAAEARLFLNHTEIGVVPCSSGICTWRAVRLSQGANEFIATAQVGADSATDSLHWSLSHSDRVVNIKAGDISGYAAKDGQRFGSDKANFHTGYRFRMDDIGCSSDFQSRGQSGPGNACSM
jgi:hypothetical protein